MSIRNGDPYEPVEHGEQGREKGGSSNANENTVDGRSERRRKYVKNAVLTTVTAVITTLTLIKVGAGALTGVEEIYDHGGLCAYDVVRLVELFESKCPEEAGSDETPEQ